MQLRLNKLNTLLAAGALTLAAGAMLPSSPAMAQGRGHWQGGGGPRGDYMSKMAHDLNLTPAQQKRIRPIFENARRQMMVIHNDRKLTQDQKRSRAHALIQQSRRQVDAILTPAQRKKRDQTVAQRRQQWAHSARMHRQR
jgi:Spy/CpxP family protein refolding chaperone